MTGVSTFFLGLEGQTPMLALSGVRASDRRRNSIEKLVDFLSRNIVLFEENMRSSTSSRREGLLNFLFLFPRFNGRPEWGESSEGGSSLFALDLKLANSILEQRALLEDLVVLLGGGQYDVFERLYSLLIKFTPLDLRELLSIENIQESMICIYFTVYLSIILKVYNYENVGGFVREKDIEEINSSWINMFISQMDCLLDYFNSIRAADMANSDINNDCLLLICALILYLVFSIISISDERRAEYKSVVIQLIGIQPGDIRFNYWYLKILLMIIERIGAELSVSELVSIILRYQRFIGVQSARAVGIENQGQSMNKLGVFEVHMMSQLCREWVSREVTLKKQLVQFVEQFVFTYNAWSEHSPEGYFSKMEHDSPSIGSASLVFLKLVNLFCKGFGISMKDLDKQGESSVSSDPLEIDSLVLLDLLSEFLQGRNSQKIAEVVLFDSIRLLVTVLTILVDPRNFENENYNIKGDIIQGDLTIINASKGGWGLKALQCFDLIEKLFVIITGLIIRHKSVNRELNISACTISSVSSSSTSSAFKTTTFDISLFLIVWNNYVTLMTSRESRHDIEVLNRSIRLIYMHLINNKYRLDVLCEITFPMSEFDDGLPVFVDERYSGLIDPWIILWRNYLDENSEIFQKRGDEIEKIFTVPNISYFFGYLQILDQAIQEVDAPMLVSSGEKEHKSTPKISSKVLELTGIVSSILVCHKISHVSAKHNTLMAILSASENPRIMSDHIYKQVTNSLNLDGPYIYNCLKFFRERWSSSTKVRVFSLISDLYISHMKQSLFQFIQCLLGNLSLRGGVFERSFALFKIRGMRGIISDEDFEILQQKLTDTSSHSNYSLGDGSTQSLIKNEIFFGCYSIDLYYTINNIQKGWQSPSLSISPSSPKTFLSKKRHSSLVITDSEDVYSIINRLNPLFDQLSSDEEYLKIFMDVVGEISGCYFHFIFDELNFRSRERRLVEQISNFSEIFGVRLEDSKLATSLSLDGELFDKAEGTDPNEQAIQERLNYRFYSQIIIRMIYICTWMVVDNINESYRSLSEIFVDKILNGILGICVGDEEYSGEAEIGRSPLSKRTDCFHRFDSSVPDCYLLEHYTRFVCVVWSIISSLNPESVLRSLLRILGSRSLSYYQLYMSLVLLLESSDWFIGHDYFQHFDLLHILEQVELMASLSEAYSRYTGESSALDLKILLVCLILKSVTVERSGAALESCKKRQLTVSKSCHHDLEISQIKINTFNNKRTQRDAYTNGGKSMVNSSYFLSARVLPYLWSFYESYPTYKDIYTRLLQTSTQLTTCLDGLCVNLYDSKTWQGIMSNFNNMSSESLIDIFDNRLLTYSQYIVLEYIWEYYINGNTLILIEKYISALTFYIYNLKKAGFLEVWLFLSLWKRYPTRIYRHMMKVNSTWIVPFLMDHLIHYSILVRNQSFGLSSSGGLINVFENIGFENTFSFLLYHYHPQHYHERMSGKYFWYIVNSEQGYLNKINSHSTEMKSLAVSCRYIHGGSNPSVYLFHDYLHYIGHSLPFPTVIYLLSNQFSSEKKKFMSNSHHFHHYFHHSMYTSTLIVWSCVRSLLLFQEVEWELLLIQYMEIIKSSKKNSHLVLTCLLDMALKSTRFSQILSIYTNNPNSPIMNIFQKCLFKECDSLLTFRSKEGRRSETGGERKGRCSNVEDIQMTSEKGVINRLRTVQDCMEGLTQRMSSVSSLINKCLDGISGASGGLNRPCKSLLHVERKQHSLANIQFSFFYILCQLGEMAKYRYRGEGGVGLPLEEDENPSALIGRLNSKEITQLKSEIAQDLLAKIENVIQTREYRNVPFLNTNMLKSSQSKTRLLSIKKINRLKILQSAKNIPYLLSLQLSNQGSEGQRLEGSEMDRDEDYELTVNLIVKCNDDCRQDVITMQYIHVFQKIFEMYNIPVWLYPYRILPMMFKDINHLVVYGGIIEFIEDSISLHEIHELHPEGGLKAYYESTFGDGKGQCGGGGRTRYEQARYNFISSLAGYSIACYVLQIKDRHNGNILITKDGHIIHIDYGFIFDISPGNNLHFERAAFKVTQEMLEFMDDQVDLFDDLCLSGFLAVREHADLLLSLTQMLLNSGIPCFRGETIKKLKQRLLLNFSQQQASNIFSKKIHSAHNHITTKGYDFVQFIQQGIK
ncbi:membrane associated protein phosphatidylinositol 4-kinase domain-containing protein [Cryptosporidium canis]|uniref:Membrane associated protein phosphatidylinositol 4-kinase domain-containing protein n=1 Tax=Cryptosporidium canis TaxID=195482 RepID=A0A9D5DJE7_9CRYT|nr:membrane associated protein phosphatidylinositol 4-kinase domain-containing protein [Cryptosporidium canis]